MVDYSFLELWAKKATWSIREAALLVNKMDPAVYGGLIFEPRSTSRPSAVFFWLNKELRKGRLSSVAESDGELLFSPGTLVRRLVERKKFRVSMRLRRALDQPEESPGTTEQNLKAIERFRHAAQLIWADYPHLSAKDMSEMLVMLPSFVPDGSLPPMSQTTIRNYLKGRGPHKAGRPSKSSQNFGQIDLAPYAKKI